MSTPECLPLKTVEEVLGWEAGRDALSVSTTKLVRKTEAPKNVPKTLICHDMRGGYLQDRFVQGCDDPNSYRFYHWQYIESFVYFSHYFVTIPPPSFTNAAHRHGVQMFGTLITEWDDGKIRCDQVIESDESYKVFADKMVAITQYYGFDGWLINIENPVQGDKVQRLCNFVSYLTEKLHKEIPGSQVIWYDSVISTGLLRWQDALNENNKMFFDVCDGIFLNYNWNDAKLTSSKTLGGDRAMDVYVGIDVFGRGCLGGGGYNSIEALNAIRFHNMSAAIFAQGWVYEKHGEESFTQNENKFWGMLQHLLPVQNLTTDCLPLSTSFCHGFGQKYYLNGKPFSSVPWHNMSCQELQPMFTSAQFDGAKSSSEMCLSTDKAYNGGACLQLKATLQMGGAPVLFKLFSTNITVKEPALVSFSCTSATECDMFLEMDVKCSGESSKFIFRENSTDKENKDKIFLPSSKEAVKALNESMKEIVPDDEGQWKTRYFLTSDTDIPKEFEINSINVGLYATSPAGGESNQRSALLGQIQIIPLSCIKTFPKVKNITAATVKCYRHGDPSKLQPTNQLTWTCEHASAVKYFNVYTGAEDNLKLLGQAQHCMYQTGEPTGSKSRVWIQPMLCVGFAWPIRQCENVELDL